MLKLVPDPTFVASVSIPVPGGDDQLINVTFRHQGRKALQAWVASMIERGNDAAILNEVVAGWDGLDAEFSAATLAALVDAYPGSARALFETYVGELGRAAAKN